MNLPPSPAPTLYVSDLDGTLLGPDSRISAETAGLLNQLTHDHQLLFTVATARTPATVVPLMQQVETSLPYVVMSGAALWHPRQGAFSHVQVIEPEVERAMAGIFARHGLNPFIYRQHGQMLHAHHCPSLQPCERAFVEPRQGLALKCFMLDEADPFAPCADPALLIFAIGDYEPVERVYRDVVATDCCTAVFYHDIFDPSTGLLEIYRRGTSKAAAIARLARQAGAERVVAFGDNLNDLPMLRAATYAVAVGNAVPQVKAVAHEVIAPNTQHSVARWIASQFQPSKTLRP